MKEIALHILDIVENGLAAGATSIEIAVEEDAAGNRLRVSVADDGRGMDARKLGAIGDPFVTSRTTRVAGLGIPLLKEAAEACNGGLEVRSTPGQGTALTAEFQRDHIDRMPLGDLAGTVLSLVVANPEIRWRFRYRADGRTFHFDTDPVKRTLGDVPLSEPAVLRVIRETLQEGIRDVQAVPA
ncbi:MAG TPA: ATP-binding protein [Candidatus Methylomirabilis sp.]|nr:ATP-binding protein [Candidatus Methylomirabilis sp.]